jgi:hypothetical protein
LTFDPEIIKDLTTNFYITKKSTTKSKGKNVFGILSADKGIISLGFKKQNRRKTKTKTLTMSRKLGKINTCYSLALVAYTCNTSY